MCLLLQRGNSCAKIKNRHVTKDGIEACSREEIRCNVFIEDGRKFEGVKSGIVPNVSQWRKDSVNRDYYLYYII
jgi:hypothetical protein